MRTSESFFPTRTHIKSRGGHRDHIMQVMKPKGTYNGSPKMATEPVNIFKDESNPAYRESTENRNLRPVGGDMLFKKMIQSGKESNNDYKKTSKKSNRDNTLRNIVSSNGSRFRRDKNEASSVQDVLPLKSINENQKK
jgi:hypothetical protein